MPDVLRAFPARDPLIRDDTGLEWLFPVVQGCRGNAAQPGHRRDLRTADRITGAGHDLVEPRRGEPLEVDVAFDTRQQAARAEGGQSLVHLASRLAELRVTRVAEGEYRVGEAVELRRALAGDVLDEAPGVVGRVAVTVRADHDREQAFTCEVLQRVVARREDPHGEAGGFGCPTEPLGDALAVTCLRAVDDREPRCGVRPRGDGRRGTRALVADGIDLAAGVGHA